MRRRPPAGRGESMTRVTSSLFRSKRKPALPPPVITYLGVLFCRTGKIAHCVSPPGAQFSFGALRSEITADERGSVCMPRLIAMLAMLAPMQAFVLPSARAAPRKSIACVAQQPTGSGEYVVSRRSIAGHAAVCGALLSPSISSLTTLRLSLTLTLTRLDWQRLGSLASRRHGRSTPLRSRPRRRSTRRSERSGS